MAATVLSLPIDVPWKRLCVSEDMIDKDVCDREFPFRWRSSVALFSYQPPEEHQNYEGQIVSYLKVACSITGFQADPKEVGIENRRVDSYWNDPVVIENYKEMVSQYYGCYGAIVEVAVAPAGSKATVAKIPFSQYPYFADFEPKKREVYEIVSETGETTSRSLEDINVHKGTTTTTSHERLDILSGASAEIGAFTIKAAGSAQGQWGTKDISQQEYSDVRTTDRARELRETYSHTTQLTQMYNQFNSYHLGTNRAVFFMLPRPHIVQTEKTFVNGPRLLEGIQEIFLVVIRPKEIKDICVEAYLETAHIFLEPINEYETSVGTLPLSLSNPGTDVDFTNSDDSQFWQVAEKSDTYLPPDGWEVDMARDGGYKIESKSGNGNYSGYVTEVTPDHVTAKVTAIAAFIDGWPSNTLIGADVSMTVSIYIRKKAPTVKGYNQALFLTGRGLCCCPPTRMHDMRPPSILLEIPLTGMVRGRRGSDMTIKAANQLRQEIGHQLIRSVNHPDRYPAGTVSFVESRFLAQAMAGLIRTARHPDNNPASEIKGLDASILKRITRVSPRISRGRLLQMSFDEAMDRYGLTVEQARQLRRGALGLEGPPPDPKDRWKSPKRSSRT